MKINIRFPENIIFYQNLILQRTSPFIELGGENALNEWFRSGNKEQLTEYLFNNNLLNKYLQKVLDEIVDEVDKLLQFSAEKKYSDIVSIGPGNGILELIFFIKNPFKKILLIDIESTSIHQHSFYTQGSGYSSLEDTKIFLMANNIPAEQIFMCNPKVDTLPDFKFDLLISMISMGFHYPCDDYVDFILSNIRKSGNLILDKRKNVRDDGFAKLEKQLKFVDQIESKKSYRIFFANEFY